MSITLAQLLKYLIFTIIKQSEMIKLLKNLPPQYLLMGIIFFITLPACRTKEGCAASQKSYVNNMEKKSNGGKSNLFSKSMRKKMKK